ncbi:MAG: sensor histidine kinase [Blautia sp.]|nr:sensor histidine kinase [Blautia sp.]
MGSAIRSFGETYTYQLVIQLNMLIQLLSSGLILSLHLQRKKRAWAYFILSLALCLLILFPCVVFRTHHGGLTTRFLMRFLQFAMPFVMILLCKRGPLLVKIKAWCAGIAAMEIGAALFSFLLAILGIDERLSISLLGHTDRITALDWIIYHVIHWAIYFLVYLVAAPRDEEEPDMESKRYTTLLMISCLLFLTIPDCVSNEFRQESWAMLLVNRFYLFALSVFILVLCNGIELWSQTRAEMKVLEQVFALERKQYSQLKENIEVLNMHCHDLKRQLEDFSGKLTQEEISSLREAMQVYEGNLKTGNEALDVILYLAQLSCQKEGIELTCLADGAALSFMQSRHIYSLFQNALGNAMEAVRKVTDPEKRVVSLTLIHENHEVLIELTNFFDGKPIFTTTKQDKHHHGYGTLSMQYILKRYGGTLTVQTQGDIFNLTMRIPRKEGEEI